MEAHVKALLERTVEHAKAALEAEGEARTDEIHLVIGFADAALEAGENPEATLVIAGEEFGPG